MPWPGHAFRGAASQRVNPLHPQVGGPQRHQGERCWVGVSEGLQ